MWSVHGKGLLAALLVCILFFEGGLRATWLLRRISDSRKALSLFKEQPSVFMRALVFGMLALCLMVADARLHLSPTIRQGVALVIAPLEWAAQQPMHWWDAAHGYFVELEQAHVEQDTVRVRLVQQSLRAALVENLMLENRRLRALVDLRDRQDLVGRAAEVLYEAPDPYSQKLIIDRGRVQGVRAGSPVLDEQGVLGQVSRVLPLTSEVTLLTNQEFTVSITNARTGAFGVVYGAPTVLSKKGTGSLELRFIHANADVRVGDLLITSGIDGVYPVGLPVARVVKVEQSPASMFARIWCDPVAGVHNTRYVMIVSPSWQLIEDSESIENASGDLSQTATNVTPMGDGHENQR